MARWALIAGPKHSAKGEVALALAERLEAAGVPVAGFLQVARSGSCDDEPTQYELLDLGTRARLAVARSGTAPASSGGEPFCSVTFWPEAFAVARGWLERDAAEADVVFLGEVGKLEVGGGGHDAAIEEAFRLDDSKTIVLCVRAEQLFDVIDRYGLDDPVLSLELPVTDAERDRFLRQAAEALAGSRRGAL